LIESLLFKGFSASSYLWVYPIFRPIEKLESVFTFEHKKEVQGKMAILSLQLDFTLTILKF